MKTVSINFNTRTASRGTKKVRRHRLSKCTTTGLARYRDRHQARDGARALSAGSERRDVSSFACPDCHGWHVEKNDVRGSAPESPTSTPTEVFEASLVTRKRRYFLVDVENPTYGAKATCEELAVFWRILKAQAPGVAPHDHVVVGASRRVARKYRGTLGGSNLKWVVGADAPDGADRALLGAIDLYRVARDFDELVIVSGDHAFADLARRAKRFGLSVQVITTEHPEQRSMLSRELAAAADVHTLVRLKPRTSQPDRSTPNPIPQPRSARPTRRMPVAA